MSTDNTITKSLVEQILDDMLARLEKREEIDPETLKRLTALARGRGLKQAKAVEEAIKGPSGGQP